MRVYFLLVIGKIHLINWWHGVERNRGWPSTTVVFSMFHHVKCFRQAKELYEGGSSDDPNQYQPQVLWGIMYMSLIILRFLKRKRVETMPLGRFGDQMLLQLRVEICLVYSQDMINQFCWKLRIIGALRKMSLLSKFKKVNFCTCIIHIHLFKYVKVYT